MKQLYSIILITICTFINAFSQTISTSTGATSPTPETLYWYEYTPPEGINVNGCNFNWLPTNGQAVVTTSDGTTVGSKFNQRVYLKWTNNILNDGNNIYVSVSLTGCANTSLDGTKTLPVNPKYLPQPIFKTSGGSTITTLNVPCYTPEINLRVEAIADAEYYRWELPAGWSKKGSPGVNLFSTTSPTVDVTTAEGNSNVVIKAYTSIANFNGPSSNLTVTRNPETLTFIANPTVYCNSSKPVTYSVAPIPSATYIWTYPTGWTCSSGCTTNSAVLIPNGQNVSGQQIRVSASSTCGGQTRSTEQSSQTISFSTSTSPEFIVSGPTVVCTSNATFSVPYIAPGIPVTWSVTPTNLFTTSSGTGSTAILNAASSTSFGNAQITFTILNACGTPITLHDDFWVGKPYLSSLTVDGAGVPISCDLGFYETFTGGNHVLTATFFGGSTSPSFLLNSFGSPYVYGGSSGSNFNFNVNSKHINEFEFTISSSLSNPCGSTTTCTYFTNWATFTSPYPNPSNDELSLQLEAAGESKQVSIFNSNQEKVFESGTTEKELVINTAFMPDGYYIVKIMRGSKISTHRLQIKH